MMKRRIFPWVGAIVMLLSLCLGGEILAQEIYRVKQGDNVSLIAKKYGVTVEALREANNLEGNKIKRNQVLTIPRPAKQRAAKLNKSQPYKADYYRVKKGDNIYRIAKKTGLSVDKIKEINSMRGNALKVGQKILLAKVVAPDREKPSKSAVSDPDSGDLEEEDGNLAGESADNALLAESEKVAPPNSELLGKWNNPEERKLFVKVATAFLGAPYRWGGASLRGLDCSAFVKKIYQLFDVSLPRTAHEQAKVGVPVGKDELMEGDLVFFNTKRLLGHVGIYIGDNKFVHASSGNRVVKIDSLEEPYYDKHFATAVRLKGLDEVL